MDVFKKSITLGLFLLSFCLLVETTSICKFARMFPTQRKNDTLLGNKVLPYTERGYLYVNEKLSLKQDSNQGPPAYKEGALTNGCGGYLNVSGAFFSSPNFPSNYGNKQNCSYVIEAPAGQIVLLSFSSFSVEYHPMCKYDSVKVYEGNSFHGTLLAILCKCTIPDAVYTIGNQMFVSFTTDANVTASGFNATVTFVDESSLPKIDGRGCGGYFNVSGDSFSSPNFPSDYNNSEDCNYVIEAPAHQVVLLNFSSFDIEYHGACCYDAVKVYEGTSLNGTLLANLCGSTMPNAVYTSGNQMFVSFTTNYYDTAGGFNATITFVDLSSTPKPFLSEGCGGYFDVSEDSFSSPNFPSDYNNNEDCSYVIEAPAYQVVLLNFSSFDIRFDFTCSYDSVKVYEGTSVSGTLLANLCGSTIPNAVYTNGNQMFVSFTTDYFYTAGGFNATVTFADIPKYP